MKSSIGGVVVGVTWACAVVLAFSSARADEVSGAEVSVAEIPEQTRGVLQRDRFSLKTASELSLPALADNPSSVPNIDGDQLDPINLFTVSWLQYEIAKDLKIVYGQKFVINLSSNAASHGMSIDFRNPRFALRKSNFFNLPNLTSTYDVYIQPGITESSVQNKRILDVGFRTNTSYEIPKTHLSFGLLTEFYESFYGPLSSGTSIAGAVVPWVTYDFSKVFSTQHYFNLGFKKDRAKGWNQFELDTPYPYLQNGIGMNITPSISTAVLINNYVQAPISLRNTWASLMLNVTLL